MKCKDCNVWGCQHRTSNAEQECVLQNIAGHIITQPSKVTKKFLVLEGTAITVDWSSFRREAAKDILAGMVAKKVYRAHPDDNDEDDLKEQQRAAKRAAFTAIVYADELIKQLKQE